MREWIDIPGYEGIYRINCSGEVQSMYRREISRNKFGSMVRGRGGILLKQFLNNYEYMTVELNLNNRAKKFPIHRLVYQAFIGELIKGLVIHHIDENKLNNHYSNLVQITYKEHSALHNKIKEII